MDDNEYLQEGFDPNSITVPKLRNILLKHDVDFNSSAKKAELVKLFSEHITPNAPNLLRDMESVMPHGAGIVNAPPRRRMRSASPEKSVKESPRKSSKLLKSPKSKTNLKPVEESKPDLATTESSEQSPKKRGRKTLSKPFIQPSSVNTENDDHHDTRTRSDVLKISGPSSRPKKEFEQEKIMVKDETSPFSNKNVFQSKSPKASPRRSKTPSRQSEVKKRSLPVENDEEESNVLSVKKKRSINKESNANEKMEVDDPSEIPQFTELRESMTPATAIRHFAAFPDSPGDFHTPEQPTNSNPYVAPQTAPQPQREDFTFHNVNGIQTDRRISNKRLSFMPDISELKMSNEFSGRLNRQSMPMEIPQSPELTSAELVQSSENEKFEKLQQEVDEELEKKKEEEKQQQQLAETKVRVKSKKLVRRSLKRSVGYYLRQLLNLVLISSLIGYVYWWRNERIEVGYCNVGFVTSHGDHQYWNQNNNNKPLVDRVVEYMRPKCVPCPTHATCYPHFRAICDEDFVHIASPLSIGGLFPVAPTCVPDTEKQHRIFKMTERAKQVLRQRNADAECGKIPREMASMEIEELRDALYRMKVPSLSDEEFDDLWRHAIKDIENEDEIIVERIRKSYEGYAPPGEPTPILYSTKTIIQSTSLASVSFQCRIELGMRAALARYRSELGGILGLVAIGIVVRVWNNRRNEYNSKINTIVVEAFRQLSRQQKKCDSDIRGLTPRYVPAAHLRDSIFVDVDQRDKQWKEVQRRIELNSNVRVRQMEVHGEIMRVFEWVGRELEHEEK